MFFVMLTLSPFSSPAGRLYFPKNRGPHNEEDAMRKKTFSEEQIALALRDAETGMPVTEVCRKMGVSEQSFYRWKKKYFGMGGLLSFGGCASSKRRTASPRGSWPT